MDGSDGEAANVAKAVTQIVLDRVLIPAEAKGYFSSG